MRMNKMMGGILALAMMTSMPAWAAKTAVKPAAKPAPVVVVEETTTTQKTETMKTGLTYNFDLDFKIFNLSNPNFASSNGTSDWFFYPTYRAMLSNVFSNGFAVYADLEKPGYASITYPTLKINELYAKYREGKFYVKLGRQIIGDTSDLLLGLQNDAIAAGFDLGDIDLQAFLAKTSQLMPWSNFLGGTMDGLLGFVPTFSFGQGMGLKGYLLIGTESITVTSGAPPTISEKVNAIITLGGKYFATLDLGDDSQVDLAGQLGLQFAMAQNAAAQSIDATNVGLKLDAGYSNLPKNELGFKIAGHVIFTGGMDTAATTPKAPFLSPNSLVGSGPGLFSKIQDGAGPYSFLDSLPGSLLAPGNTRVQEYDGVMALGASAGLVTGRFDANAGFWTYMDNYHYAAAPSTNSLGSEIDVWAGYQLLSALKLYAQLAMYLPSNPTNASPAPGSAMKFLVGSTLSF